MERERRRVVCGFRYQNHLCQYMVLWHNKQVEFTYSDYGYNMKFKTWSTAPRRQRHNKDGFVGEALKGKMLNMSDALFLNVQENQLVLFADIIGFSKAVYENEKVTMEDSGKLIVNFPIVYENFSNKYSLECQEAMGIKFMWVSDSIIITTHKDNADKLFSAILDITNGLLVASLSLRGAIALGNVHHERNIWGTAYIEAVKTEGSKAVYPRIIIKESVVNTLKTPYKKFISKTETPDYMQFNFFDCYFDSLMRDSGDITANISVYGSFIIDSYNKATNPEHVEKYVWLAQELISAVDKYSDYIDTCIEENEVHSTIAGDVDVRLTSYKDFLGPLKSVCLNKTRT